MLPNFLIIGSQKAGTTSLYNVLKQHPQIFLPKRKEVNYFFLQSEYDKGLKHYLAHFEPAPPEALAVGEASPGYICHPLAPACIHRRLPDAKLILTVRHPADRAYSQYWDNRRSLSEHRTFEQAVETALHATYHPDKLGYFSRGTYIQYIQRYLELFDRDQLLVLPFDNLRTDPHAFYRRVFEFLGVDQNFTTAAMTESFNPAAIWHNPLYRFFFKKPSRVRWLPARLRRFTFFGERTPWRYPPMQPETRQKILDFYHPWNMQLAEFLGQDLSAWDR
jgi:hypothetical protein